MSNLDMFWEQAKVSKVLQAESPEPAMMNIDIIEDLRSAMEQLEEIAGDVSVAD